MCCVPVQRAVEVGGLEAHADVSVATGEARCQREGTIGEFDQPWEKRPILFTTQS